MKIVYIDAKGHDRSRIFRALVAMRRVLPSRIMRSLWYRLLSGPGSTIDIARTAILKGDGELRIQGTVTLREGVKIDVRHPGIVALESNVIMNCYAYVWQAEGGVMTLGKHSYVGPNAYLDGSGGLTIGESALIGPGAAINTSTYGMAQDRPYREQPHAKNAVYIGANAWLGARVVVTMGVRIGESAIVGAGAVVTQDVPARTISTGVPARVLKALT